MIVTKKKELERVVQLIRIRLDYTKDIFDHTALTNVMWVLYQAIEEGDFDEEHDAYTLKVVKQPNQLDDAIQHCCNTSCLEYRGGVCPFPYKYKKGCPKIKEYLLNIINDEEE